MFIRKLGLILKFVQKETSYTPFSKQKMHARNFNYNYI